MKLFETHIRPQWQLLTFEFVFLIQWSNWVTAALHDHFANCHPASDSSSQGRQRASALLQQRAKASQEPSRKCHFNDTNAQIKFLICLTVRSVRKNNTNIPRCIHTESLTNTHACDKDYTNNSPWRMSCSSGRSSTDLFRKVSSFSAASCLCLAPLAQQATAITVN